MDANGTRDELISWDLQEWCTCFANSSRSRYFCFDFTPNSTTFSLVRVGVDWKGKSEPKRTVSNKTRSEEYERCHCSEPMKNSRFMEGDNSRWSSVKSDCFHWSANRIFVWSFRSSLSDKPPMKSIVILPEHTHSSMESLTNSFFFLIIIPIGGNETCRVRCSNLNEKIQLLTISLFDWTCGCISSLVTKWTGNLYSVNGCSSKWERRGYKK